ncbi:LpqB family beta-propeller domain-containing protein [Angustibacter sp. McL0619]|uniref:LpqB family beta-propeller domain-containing protein n=1 Tax=Angustibacter sp. McL0619 TaxID=3415676 RepID=UPI003CE93709
MSRRRSVLLGGLALALVASLTACGSAMPDSGVAGAGRPIGEGSSREPLQIAPVGPRPDAGPAEIVGGFLKAGAGFDGDHAVARTFLDGEARAAWRPAQGTIVYPDDPSLTVVSHGSGVNREVVVSAPVYGTIDADGRFAPAKPGTTARTTFQVRRLGQVWRIETLSAQFGLWMPRYEFQRSYTPLRISFVATGTRQLVSDQRWFAGSRASLATAAVRALLAGPPAYLKDAVTTGFPTGTTLGVDAVPTSGGTAQIDLSTRALAASPDQRQQLWSQLFATLHQLPTVNDIEVTAGGGAFQVPGVGAGGSDADLGFRDNVQVAGPVLVLSGGRLKTLDAAGALSPQISGRFAGRLDVSGLRSIAAGPHDDAVVGVDGSGTRLLSIAAQSAPEELGRGGDLVPPVIDRSGWAWTADRAAAGRMLVAPATSSGAAASQSPDSSVRMEPRWLTGRTVIALDVARDGSRVAVVSAAADGSTRLDVAGVVRGDSGRPTSLAQPWQVGQSLASVSDVSWADRTTLVVLGGQSGQRQPYQVEVGGEVSALPKLPSAVGVMAGSGVSSVYLTLANGHVVVRAGSGWRDLGAATSVTIPS